MKVKGGAESAGVESATGATKDPARIMVDGSYTTKQISSVD
jgi:hypothetical protein